jgi:hypothetical protein
MDSKFIELTRFDAWFQSDISHLIIVNSIKIISINRDCMDYGEENATQYTLIKMETGHQHWVVETPEQIMGLLNGA